ncbi:hypothetical protein J3F83DRAFT_752884 [Trichoderma novae-zelandiae]
MARSSLLTTAIPETLHCVLQRSRGARLPFEMKCGFYYHYSCDPVLALARRQPCQRFPSIHHGQLSHKPAIRATRWTRI